MQETRERQENKAYLYDCGVSAVEICDTEIWRGPTPNERWMANVLEKNKKRELYWKRLLILK